MMRSVASRFLPSARVSARAVHATRVFENETFVGKAPAAGVGTASPWAVDAWDSITSNMEEPAKLRPPSPLLERNAVAIPLAEAEREGMPEDSVILEEYEARLKQRSSMHLGYPVRLPCKATL